MNASRSAALLLAALPLCLCAPFANADAAPERHWTAAGWGGGGWFWAAAFDPADPDTLYLAGDVAGVYKSTDGAQSWTFVNRGLHNYGVYSLAVAPSDGRVLYAMTVDGIARSDDAGAHWTPLAATRGGKGAAMPLFAKRGATVRGVAVDPSDPRTVYAGGATGALARSADGGETWTRLDYEAAAVTHDEPEAAAAPIATVSVSAANPALVFAAHARLGLLRSEDAGATWTRPATPHGAMHVTGGLAAAPDRFYAAFGTNGVWMSSDAGRTWTRTAGKMDADMAVREIAVDPRDPDTVHAIARHGSDSTCFVSRDAGATWEGTRAYERDYENNPTLPHEPKGRRKSGLVYGVSSIALSPANPDRIFVAANWNNIASRDGGRTWTESARGADISCVFDLRFLPAATVAGQEQPARVYAVAMDEGLLCSTNNGAAWFAISPKQWTPGLSGHQWRVLPRRMNDGRILTVSTVSAWKHQRVFPNKVLAVEGDGEFSYYGHGLPTTRPTKNTMWEEGYARALAADPKNPDVLYLGIDGEPEGGVFRSSDGGRTWAALPAQPASRRMFFGIAVDATDSARLYWGACGNGAGVYTSPDAGRSWRRTSLGEWIFNIEALPSGAVLAGGKNLWRSADHGSTWKRLTNFEGLTVVGIACDPADERRLWVSGIVFGTAAGGGVYESTDGGASWRCITGDLPYIRPYILRYNPVTRELWAAGVGIFKTKAEN